MNLRQGTTPVLIIEPSTSTVSDASEHLHVHTVSLGPRKRGDPGVVPETAPAELGHVGPAVTEVIR